MKDTPLDYTVLPSSAVGEYVVQTYWQTLAMADTLKYRLANLEDPTWEDVKKIILNFSVLDTNGVQIAEFALEKFTGKSAMVHFSMHPYNPMRRSIQLASDVTDTILNDWRNDKGEHYLDSLYGITPATNRVASLFILKAGFKRIGILPSGLLSRGKIVDGLITAKVRRNL